MASKALEEVRNNEELKKELEETAFQISNGKSSEFSYQVPYFEASAKTGEKVNEAFATMAKLAVEAELR